MTRREFSGLVGGAVAWPVAAKAQQADKVYRIGYLGAASAAAQATRMSAFRAGLAALGYVEGIEHRHRGAPRRGFDTTSLRRLRPDVIELKVDALGSSSSRGAAASAPTVVGSSSSATAASDARRYP